MAMTALKNDGCSVLPPRYQELISILERSFSPMQAYALAKVMREIDVGAGELTARNILEEDGGFAPDRAEELARILYSVHKRVEGDAA